MPLSFAAVTPHPAALIPTVGKDGALEALEKTRLALERLEKDLYIVRPQIIVVISPHEGRYDNAFVINAHTVLETTFATFGDAVTQHTFAGAPELAAQMSAAARRIGMPLRLMSDAEVGQGTTVPLHYLTAHLPETKIMPIGFSNLRPHDHIAFGALLKDVIMHSPKRIAVIASGDLSHSLTQDAPAGYNEVGASLDGLIRNALNNHDVEALCAIDPAIIEAADECGYRSLLILMGTLQNMHARFDEYSYEYPFGVGYLVGNFTL